ncbi:ABC transporter ATP-binding protein [archaeon]|nr:MAG: ABC transporter ATP-binding protein [archaeon]RLG64848.1 MAG: ABC transporter ATP-binding protein [archaeon]HDM23415.1 ABC transporter ATP-binding protein [Candidatus Bathyarchaeota archaeon]
MPIEFRGVYKTYDGVIALEDVSLEIPSGKVCALLGPNGSGKSTLMKIALGLVKPDAGTVSVNGLDPFKEPIRVRRIVGYVPEEITLYESLTPAEYLSFVASVYGIEDPESRALKLAELFEFTEHMYKLGGELSHGNRRKLMIISALMHDPKVLIFDEPFSGLDPTSGKVLKELLREYASRGRTVLLSTHILELAEAIADRVIVIHKGRVVAEGDVDELKKLTRRKEFEDVFFEVTGLSKDLDEMLKALKEV